MTTTGFFWPAGADGVSAARADVVPAASDSGAASVVASKQNPATAEEREESEESEGREKSVRPGSGAEATKAGRCGPGTALFAI
ncbi:hypothetical protein [Rhodovulum sp. PH10]|uniref:hypothetical protein n=1 Tax=Rhodovulum sp. PH10 TaxID=1187851 RepID=UPI0012F958A5|nr:hypothetical protein [Rhodovulum sp. PH10]